MGLLLWALIFLLVALVAGALGFGGLVFLVLSPVMILSDLAQGAGLL